MQTPFTTTDEAIAGRKWLVVDLEGVTLGRAAAKIAHVLRGKHKPSFTPHIDDGDFVIALNVSIAAAISALAFLIVIHKLEYFINAKIVGGKINARVWELLIAMVIMERLLGVVGVVAAPVFYAWLKSEWLAWDRRHERAAA